MNDWERKKFNSLLSAIETVSCVGEVLGMCFIASMCFHVSKHICAKIFH